jgi:ABC-type glycerol-3-phosphate transport system substrate-binding protein
MDTKNLSRRDFLRLSALAAAGAVATRYATGGVNPLAAADAMAAPPAAQEVTLDVMAPAPEYANPYREIWNVFEAQNPGIKINLFSINEDTKAAYEAKIAAGQLPAMENTQDLQITANKTNYQTFLNLGDIGFPWFDRWTYDVKSAWADLFGLPGPRTLDIYHGFVWTWQYNSALMARAGLDPRRDVKTWEDWRKWIEEGTQWAKGTDGVDHFWDQGWHSAVLGRYYPDILPMAFKDGQRELQCNCWSGKAKFNAEDSPYRYFFEIFKEANDKGWIPESCWTREWEADMEASFISGKSVMMLHGPWVWDKVLAADPEFKQSGLPATPPADGQTPWMQYASPPQIDAQYFIRAGADQLSYWEQIKTAFFWFFSPEAIPMRAQAEGRLPAYNLDEPFELQGPQYLGVVKDIIGGELWPGIVLDESFNGETVAAPYVKKGAKGVFDWQANGHNKVFADVLSGKMTIGQALDWLQANWQESYEGLPASS